MGSLTGCSNTSGKEQLVRLKLEAVSRDSTSVKVHPDGTGARKTRPPGHRQVPRGWTPKMHLGAADARTAVTFARSPGQTHAASEGRKLLRRLGGQREQLSLLRDRVSEGNATRPLALTLGFEPVGSPLKTRRDPWEDDRELDKRRNEVERLFRRLKGIQRIFSRFERLAVSFLGFIVLALILDALR